jgi:cell division septation protein DedD
MPTMVTFRGGRAAGSALLAALLVLAGGCSREQEDWRAAQGAATPEAYDAFIEQHPNSELVKQAHAALAQLAEDGDWQRARAVATLPAYQQFLAQHPSGRWAEDARIRIEGFSLGSAPHLAAGEAAGGISPLQGSTGMKLLQLSAASASRETPDGAGAADQAATPASATDAVTDTATTIRVATASVPLAPSAQPPLASDGGYAVQLGAFGTRASASAEWSRLQMRFGTELNGLSPRIVLASTAGGQLYRLQVPTADEAQARAICSSLKQQWQACLAVPR